MTSDPIRLFWWNRVRNFGDRISADVVEAVSGRPVVRAMPAEADLFAVGSVMNLAYRGLGRANVSRRPVIWGTGLMGSVPGPGADRLQFAAVRGPLTQALLDLPALPLGDPGLLVSMLFATAPKRDDKIGIVLHFSQTPDPAVKARLSEDGRFRFIDVTARNHLDVVRQIAACRHVFSSSLHGLIVADAFGVPNTWIDSSGIHASAAFKFHDYALSVRRLLNTPLPLDQVLSAAGQLPTADVEISYRTGVEASRAALKDGFPYEQFARPKMEVSETSK